jgi:hypothetical protein
MQTIDQMGRRGILCPTMGQRVLVAGTVTQRIALTKREIPPCEKYLAKLLAISKTCRIFATSNNTLT